ncbi:MAG: Gfo/Idh/MocA family oxidoreductase [Candidatus Bathyarchaeia archaeon]
MSKIGVGIIGLDHWYWALGSAYDIAINPDAELIAMADPNEKEVKRISKIYGSKTSYTDYHDLLANSEIKGVIITTTTSQHTEVAIAAAKAGKDILIGKPIARTLREADQIIEAKKKAGVKLMAMAAGPLPGDPIMNLINKGVIGTPFAAYFSTLAILPLRAPGINEPGWFVDPQKAAGGGFIDHAVYDVSLLRKYFDSEVDRIYAEMDRFVHKEYQVEDYGIAIMRFKDGSIATIESTFTAPVQSYGRKILTGTDGEIEMGGNGIWIWTKKEPYRQRTFIENTPPSPVFSRTYVEVSAPMPPFAMGYKPTIDEFIKCIKENKEPVITGQDARAVLEIGLACYQSVKEGKPVKLPLKTEVDTTAILKNL